MPIIEECKSGAIDIAHNHLLNILENIKLRLVSAPFIVIDVALGFDKLSSCFIYGSHLNLKSKITSLYALDRDIVSIGNH